MAWTDLHGELLAKAFQNVLGRPAEGAMAFVRCLTPDIVEALAQDQQFEISGWTILRVANFEDADLRTITADNAVELRESKAQATLLLVDTSRAGAGMDGIYSAAREINEERLFKEALRLAAHEVTRRLNRETRIYAERSIKKARGIGQRFRISPWTEFE